MKPARSSETDKKNYLQWASCHQQFKLEVPNLCTPCQKYKQSFIGAGKVYPFSFLPATVTCLRVCSVCCVSCAWCRIPGKTVQKKEETSTLGGAGQLGQRSELCRCRAVLLSLRRVLMLTSDAVRMQQRSLQCSEEMPAFHGLPITAPLRLIFSACFAAVLLRSLCRLSHPLLLCCASFKEWTGQV